MSQNKTVLKALRKKGLTQFQANDMGIMRLAARIYDLREKGHVINSRMIELKSGVKVAKYFLVKELKR